MSENKCCVPEYTNKECQKICFVYPSNEKLPEDKFPVPKYINEECQNISSVFQNVSDSLETATNKIRRDANQVHLTRKRPD